jgi:multidrug efflux system membrane fusion protein
LNRKQLIASAAGVAAALIAVLWLIYWLKGHSAPPDFPGRPVTTVGVATAEKSDVPIILESLGTVTPIAAVTVRPQVSGVLTQVLFTEGQMVKRGQVLAVIDPRPFEAALLEAEGMLTRDEAQLDNARITLARYQTLLKQDSIAQQDVDTQAALVKQMEGTVKSDQAAVATARLNLAYAHITSPLDGRAGLRVVDVGNFVSAGDANGVVLVTQIDPIDIEFAIPQDSIGKVQQRLLAKASLPVTILNRTRITELARGEFKALDNQVRVDTGTVRAKARVANPGGTLFANEFVNVRLQLDTLKDAVVVPAGAVRHGSSGDFVFVLQPNHTAAVRRIAQGPAYGDKLSIVNGLSAGEQVITEGGDRLTDGDEVQLPGDRPRDPRMAAARAQQPGAQGSDRQQREGGRRGRQQQPQ